MSTDTVQFQTGILIVYSTYDHLTLYQVKLLLPYFMIPFAANQNFFCFSLDDSVENYQAKLWKFSGWVNFHVLSCKLSLAPHHFNAVCHFGRNYSLFHIHTYIMTSWIVTSQNNVHNNCCSLFSNSNNNNDGNGTKKLYHNFVKNVLVVQELKGRCVF